MKKNYTKQTFKTKEEWLKAKELTISGSEAAAICNKSKWLTTQDIYNKMVMHKAKIIPENERMREGTLAEEHIRALFALDNKKYKVKNPPKKGYWFFARKDKPYISCTPDGLLTEIENGHKWGLEIKDVELKRSADKSAWEGNLLPDQYYYQLLQYMLTLNDLHGVILNAHLKYFKYDNEQLVFDYAVDRSYVLAREDVKSHIAYLEKKETDFYEINIKGRKRPKLVIKI